MWVCTCGFANRDAIDHCLACSAARPGATPAATSPAGSADSVAAVDPADLAPVGGTVNASPAASSPASAPGATGAGPATAPTLVLANMRTGENVEVVAPGGVIGREGDFSPQSFSDYVSGAHLVADLDEDGRGWRLSFVGRNATLITMGNAWASMKAGQVYPVLGGELLRMADMLFRLELHQQTCTSTCNEGDGDHVCANPHGNPAPADPHGDPASNTGDIDPQPNGWSVRCPVCGTLHPVDGPDGRVANCSFCTDPLDRRKIARIAARPTA